MIISVDPSYSKPMAIAWLDNKINYKLILDPIDYNIKTRDLHKMCLKVFDFLTTLLDTATEKIVLIEGQWLGKNPAVFAGLTEVRCLLTGMLLCKYSNAIKIINVYPHAWQGEILNVYKKKSAEIKKLSIKTAKELTNSDIKLDDIADAVCILQYGIKHFSTKTK